MDRSGPLSQSHSDSAKSGAAVPGSCTSWACIYLARSDRVLWGLCSLGPGRHGLCRSGDMSWQRGRKRAGVMSCRQRGETGVVGPGVRREWKWTNINLVDSVYLQAGPVPISHIFSRDSEEISAVHSVPEAAGFRMTLPGPGSSQWRGKTFHSLGAATSRAALSTEAFHPCPPAGAAEQGPLWPRRLGRPPSCWERGPCPRLERDRRSRQLERLLSDHSLHGGRDTGPLAL